MQSCSSTRREPIQPSPDARGDSRGKGRGSPDFCKREQQGFGYL